VIKVCNDGTLVASGDNTKSVFVWNSETKDIVIDRFVFHSSKVYDIDWSQDNTKLISCSLDRSVILWSITEKSKMKVFPEMDNEVVYTLCFVNEDKEFVCGGHSCSLKRIII
jgi:WD40 repeat protein